jgi:hypothetical protein
MSRVVAFAAALLLVVGCAGAPAPSPTDPPTTTPPPTQSLDPGAELERTIHLRRDWGLRSERDWVEQVESDPASVMSELGIMVTPQELAELEQQFADEPRGRLIAYGARTPDEFGGLWMEGGTVVLCFTADLDAHRQATAALAPGLQVDIRHCANSEAALKALQQRIVDDMPELRAMGFEFNSAGLDTINNVVRLEVKSNLPNAIELLAARYGPLLVADVYPIPGAWQNAAGGSGWRLVAAGIARDSGAAYSVDHAVDAPSFAALWASLDPVNDVPTVDFGTEIVAVFVDGIGSSCPEVRLDEVVIDHGRRHRLQRHLRPAGAARLHRRPGRRRVLRGGTRARGNARQPVHPLAARPEPVRRL